VKRNSISPSLLAADFSQLGREIELVTEAGAEMIHVDVMDGHFVPNLTLGMPVVKSIKPVSKIPLDVHLMIDKPEKFIRDFVAAGSDVLTLHVESTALMDENLRLIRDLNCRPGITLRPGTPIEAVRPYLQAVDLVLVMTVEPGFGGQSFRHEQIEKVRKLAEWRQSLGLDFFIEIDGGVDEKTAPLCWAAGADILVAGSAVFRGEKTVAHYASNMALLRPRA
jgi:ribulose-phosphate 3-epimerase